MVREVTKNLEVTLTDLQKSSSESPFQPTRRMTISAALLSIRPYGKVARWKTLLAKDI